MLPNRTIAMKKLWIVLIYGSETRTLRTENIAYKIGTIEDVKEDGKSKIVRLGDE